MSELQARTPFSLRLRRGLLRRAARLLYLILGRVTLEGLENIPRGAAYVAALNHTSIFDSPLLLSFWPESIAAIGAADVFEKPIQGQIISIYGTTPVHRGSYDRNLIDVMLDTLRSGTPLLIAPEGGRSHQPAMRRAKPGIALVVDETGVPVVPVAILGATDDFLKRGLRALSAPGSACESASRSICRRLKAEARRVANPVSAMPTWSCGALRNCCPRNTTVSIPEPLKPCRWMLHPEPSRKKRCNRSRIRAELTQ